MLNKDYKDMLRALLGEKVRFLLVGAYALAAHGYPRATMGMDVWVQPSPENAEAVLRALSRFGSPPADLTRADLERDDTVFQIGVPPRRIDIVTGATGLRFEEAFARAVEVDLAGIPVRIPSIEDMIRNKKAVGRTKDLADVEALEALKHSDRITGQHNSMASPD